MRFDLYLTDNSDFGKFNLEVYIENIILFAYVDDNYKLESQLSDRKKVLDSIEETSYIINTDKNVFYEEGIEYFKNNFDNFLDEVQFVILSFAEYDSLEFIKKNPILLSKKIVLNINLSITDYDKLLELMIKYDGILDKIYVKLYGNSDYINLLKCAEVMDMIRNIALPIKKLNLSPMEMVMYAYDKIRDREYRIEDSTDSMSKSRDLAEVLFGDKIVCLGYANIFSAILDYLGIKNDISYLANKSSIYGHARNLAYIKDSKYDIDGVYYFDLTWDSKAFYSKNNYLRGYKFFARTNDSLKNDNFEDVVMPLYSQNLCKEVKKIIKNGKYSELNKYKNTLNYMSCLVMGSYFILSEYMIDKDLSCKNIDLIFDKFNKPLSGEVLLNILNNVRKIEYYEDSSFYPYTIDDLYVVFVNSNWKFKNTYLTPQQKLLNVFGFKSELKLEDQFIIYVSMLIKDIYRVRVSKVLSLVRDEKIKKLKK